MKKPTARFISTDAIRILQNLGFQTGSVDESVEKAKNDSELLFEEYLTAVGLGYFQYEPSIDATTRRPDYLLKYKGESILFEVKEFRPEPRDFGEGGSAYDPYGPIREKINAAWQKFKDLENYVCSLVLFNAGKPLVHLFDWRIVYGAMLGNFGFQVPLDRERGMLRIEEARPAFLEGGKMRPRRGGATAWQNTTISALIALGYLPLGQRRLALAAKRIENERGGKLTFDEFWEFIEAAQGTERDPSLRQLRVVVYENPGARRPLSQELFRGNFDERYGEKDGMIFRLFAGEEIRKLEDEEKEVSSIGASE